MQKPKSSILAQQQKTNSASLRKKSSELSVSAKISPLNSIAPKEDLLVSQKSGSKATLRTHQILPPLPLQPNEIVEIRAKLRASQAVFAAYLGVSKAAVVAWERGQRKPSGAALRLLTIVCKNPKVLLKGVENCC